MDESARPVIVPPMNVNPFTNLDTAVVSAMITPAILILAAGSLVSSTLVRLGRVVDQTRGLISLGEELVRQGKRDALDRILERIERQVRRAELARHALWGYYIAIAFFLLSSVMLALNQVFHGLINWVGPALTLVGGLVLMIATASLVIEVGLSAGALRQEVDYFKREADAD